MSGPEPGRLTAAGGRIAHIGEVIVTVAAGLLVLVSVAIAAVILYVVFFNGLREHLDSIESLEALQTRVERVFAGVLLLMLGMELLKSLRSYFSTLHFQLETIVVVAMIAIARHVMLIDIEHTSGAVLAGTAALVLALSLSFALVRQRAGSSGPPT